MSEQVKNEHKDFTPADLGQVLSGIIRQAVKEELKGLTAHVSADDGDYLLTVEQLAKTLNVSEDWVYDHSGTLPFTMKLGPKMLRFSLKGVQKYLTSRRGTC